MNGSAIPAWVQQVLPQWFLDRPAFTEAVYAFILSFALSAGGIISTLYGVAAAQGKATDIGTFAQFVLANWSGAALGFIFGGGAASYRAKEAGKKAAAASPQIGTP